MSLSRQLVIIILMLFILMFAGTMFISIKVTRTYLEEQMESHAQDTATSLGLSITHAVKKNDLPTMNSMVDVVFDRGYYRDLVLMSPDGNVLISRSLSVKIEGVPDWFIESIPLETPEGHAVIMSGWTQLGELTTRSHPGYAYTKLWRSTVATFWWYVSSSLVLFIIITLVLRVALSPLKAVENMALAINAREFPVLKKIPWTRELKRVVLAMNKMSFNLKKIISDQIDLTDRLRFETHHDPVTCLLNKESFEDRIKHLIEAEEHFRPCALFIMKIEGFKEFNEEYGYAQGDEILKQLAAILGAGLSGLARQHAARISGAEYGVFIQDISKDDVEYIANVLSLEASNLGAEGQANRLCVHTGIAYCAEKNNVTELFSKADMALKTAQGKGDNVWHIHDETSIQRKDIRGAAEWKKILSEVIESDRIKILFQPIVSVDDNLIMHHEVLARVVEKDGSLMSANIFFPMAERTGVSLDLDKAIISKTIEHIEAHPGDDKYAVNISPSSINDDGFEDWLYEILEGKSVITKRLVFESSEYGLIHTMDALKDFINRLMELNISFSIDNFGVGAISFGYLQGLKVDYIKLDASYIRGIVDNKDDQFFIQSLTQIAHGLDIKVIAKEVETREQAVLLGGLKIDGLQGYFVGKPEEHE